MSKMIAVLAPSMNESIDDRGYEFIFRLKHEIDGGELSFKKLHEFATHSFQVNKIENNNQSNYFTDTIPAAGYYLAGLLRSANYNTILSNKCDLNSLSMIANHNPDVICISSTMVFNKNALKRIIDNIRKIMPDIFIIIGGPFIWKSYQWLDLITKKPEINNNEFFNGNDHTIFLFPYLKNEIKADIFIVSPHGGSILLKVLEKLFNGRNNFEDIKNLALHNNEGQIYFTHRMKEDIDYDNLYTRWDLLDKLPDILSITTSYGCPYRCGFCDFCKLQPQINFRSKESLLSEFKLIKKLLPNNLNSRFINITDDNVFITQKRVQEVCNALIESKVGLLWSGFTRAASINNDNIKLIKRSGLVIPNIGVESGDIEQLNRMNKKTNLEELKNGIELLDQIGAAVIMYFVIGYPGENNDTIQNTVNFLNNLSVQNAQFEVFPLQISPLSEVSMPENRKRFNLYGILNNWSHYTMNSENVNEYCLKLCKMVTKIQYVYQEENLFFNMRFKGNKLNKLIKLRQDLTIKIIEKAHWKSIAENLAIISEIFGLKKVYPNENFINGIICSK